MGCPPQEDERGGGKTYAPPEMGLCKGLVYYGGGLGRPLFAAALRRRRAQSSSSPSAAGTSKSPLHHGSGVTITIAIPPAAIAASPPKSATPIVVISLIGPSIEVESLGWRSSGSRRALCGRPRGRARHLPLPQHLCAPYNELSGCRQAEDRGIPTTGAGLCSLRPPLRRSETGGRGRMKYKTSRSGSSSRAQEAGHGHETTSRNPRFPMFFREVFTRKGVNGSGSFYS